MSDIAQGSSPTRLIIIGAGFAGIGLGLRLLERGERDFLILEQASGVGGTWWVNRYPGCACDVQSHLYSLSFAPKADWSRQFAPREEIQAHLEALVERTGLRRHIRLGTPVRQARWQAQPQCWQIDTADGQTLHSSVLVSAIGGLSRANRPAIPGLEQFKGPIIHSQEWPEDFDPTGQRVAVIGSGASAIQFVPRIQPQVARLDLYQRTPQWILPKPDSPISPRWQTAYERLPGLRLARRLAIYLLLETRLPAFSHFPWLSGLHRRKARRWLERQVKDPELRDKLRPDYEMGCKRVLMRNDFYPAVAADNCELITTAIDRIEAGAIMDATGRRREVDSLILATGFKATEPVPAGLIIGRDGRDLAEVWKDGPMAYKGSTVHGFPNLFTLLGPNTALGHNSVLLMIEAQIRYVLGALDFMQQAGVSAVEVLSNNQDAWNDQLQARLARTVWNRGGCASWYRHPVSGRNATLWPRWTWRFRQLTRRFDARAYHHSRP